MDSLVENWTKLAQSKGSNLKSEINTARYNYYEKYFFDYEYRHSLLSVTIYIQGIPRSIPVQLERYTQVSLSISLDDSYFFKIEERSALNVAKALFNVKLKTADPDFNKKYLVTGNASISKLNILTKEIIDLLKNCEINILISLIDQAPSKLHRLEIRLNNAIESLKDIYKFIKLSENIIDQLLVT